MIKSSFKITFNSAFIIILALFISACGGVNSESTEAVNIPNGNNSGSGNNNSTGNSSPSISGTPSTSIEQGVAYNFTPVANDNDGDNLTFYASNVPGWMSFNPSNGSLTGIPDVNNIGVYSGIVISVSDGTNLTSLPAFDLTVTSNNTGSGSATLSWTSPSLRMDGSALTNLAGFKIYYGNSSGNYTTVIRINNPGIVEYVVDNLPLRNTYYFVVTAYDANGIESIYSDMVSKVL